MKFNRVLAGAVCIGALAGPAVAQHFGMGSGTMGGYGMDHGMMSGYSNDAYAGLDLTPVQQKSISGIQEQASKAMWPLMGKMHGQGYHMQGMFEPDPFSEAAAKKAFQTMTEIQKTMFELQLETRKKIDAVLTKDQRENLSRHWSAR